MSRVFEALQRTQEARRGDRSVNRLSAQGLIEEIESPDALARRVRMQAIHEPVPAPEVHAEAPASRAEAVVRPVSSRRPRKTTEAPDVFEHFRTLPMAPTEESRLVSLSSLQGAAPEAFRLLSVRLRHLQKASTLQKLVITSTTSKEGKSLVSSNLSCTLALDTTQKVLLIEGDLRCPSLCRVFGSQPPAGIFNYLSKNASLEECIFRLESAGIWIMPAGTPSATPLDLLRPAVLTPMLDQLANWFDWIIVDAPPTLPLADTSVWSRVVDGVLLVARKNMTRKGLLAKGLESMEADKIVGTVLNCSDESLQYGDYYLAPDMSA